MTRCLGQAVVDLEVPCREPLAKLLGYLLVGCDAVRTTDHQAVLVLDLEHVESAKQSLTMEREKGSEPSTQTLAR